jgi:hypothetical protein
MDLSLQRTVLLALVVLSCIPSSTSAQPMLSIDMEGETTIATRSLKSPTTGSVEKRIFLHQADRDISTTEDIGTAYSLYRSNAHYKGQFSLGFRVERESRPPGVSEKSKIEVNVSRHDDYDLDRRFAGKYILRNGSERFLGFAFRMDDQYEAPTRWLLHVQIWQCCSTEAQPPLTFQALPNVKPAVDTIRFVLMKRNDQHIQGGGRSDNGERLLFVDGKDFIDLRKSEWYRLIFLLQPASGSDSARIDSKIGRVALWINGRLALRHLGAWGYAPQPKRGINDTYAVKVGIYRAAQNAAQQFSVDTIRWGTTFEAGDPDNP